VFVVGMPQRFITYFEWRIEEAIGCTGIERYAWTPKMWTGL
jgi:hypothetical protein